MNESAVGEMLEALSLSRTRRFCMMVEDECANLVRRNARSLGAVCRCAGGHVTARAHARKPVTPRACSRDDDMSRRLEFPPLTESLRDLISSTGAANGMLA